VMSNGDIVAGGSFTNAGGAAASNIARWNGSTWSALAAGTSGPVGSLTSMPGDALLAGGAFTVPIAEGLAAKNIAAWNGTNWSTLVATAAPNGTVLCLAAAPGGGFVAGGLFTTAGSARVNQIARWNGSTWSALGTGIEPGASVNALAW